jgi:putative aldouronate transport system substrate-binding protein
VAGVVTRGDLLEKLGMSNEDIKTFDDWDKMLRGMKDQDGVVAPLALSVIGDMGIANIIGAGFGIDATYENGSYVGLPLFVQDGKVQFGFLTDAYDRYVETLSTWYKDGLINENILSMEGGGYCEEYVLRGENTTFVTMYSNASYYAEQLGGGATYVPLYYPMETEDGIYHFSDTDPVTLESGVWNVGFDCDQPELVVQMIDWLYTEEGSRLASYGVEGEAYNLADDGTIQLTELITNNPDGLSASSAMNIYAGDLIPSVKDSSRLLSTYDDTVISAIDFISQQETDGAYNMPSGLKGTFTQEEQDIYDQYSPDLLTYMS